MLLKTDIDNLRGPDSPLGRYRPRLTIIDANYGAGKHSWDKLPWDEDDFTDAIAVRCCSNCAFVYVQHLSFSS